MFVQEFLLGQMGKVGIFQSQEMAIKERSEDKIRQLKLISVWAHVEL